MLRGERDNQYSAEFFDELDKKALSSASVIVPLIAGLLRPTSVLDVGCGRGVWLAAFQDAGVERVYGVDGPWVNPDRLHIPRECFTNVDLIRDWSVSGSYDLA